MSYGHSAGPTLELQKHLRVMFQLKSLSLYTLGHRRVFNIATPSLPIFPMLPEKRRPKKHMDLVTPKYYKGATVPGSQQQATGGASTPAQSPRAPSGRLWPRGSP